jgi:hypothetical protein
LFLGNSVGLHWYLSLRYFILQLSAGVAYLFINHLPKEGTLGIPMMENSFANYNIIVAIITIKT